MLYPTYQILSEKWGGKVPREREVCDLVNRLTGAAGCLGTERLANGDGLAVVRGQ